ncbi:hypothetical protein PTKIN_Ptkin03bG0046200 [Pterospermum kingtungense]
MPGPSIPIIPLVFMFISIPLYDCIFVPVAQKIIGIPTGIRYLQRIGVRLVLSAISMAVAGIVETRRKSMAIRKNMVDSVQPLPMKSSAGMKSLSMAISWCSLASGYFLSSMVMEVANKASGGWLANNNLNRDKLNYFYWLLAALSVVNFGIYLLCALWYRHKKVELVNQEQNYDDSRASKGKQLEMVTV